MSDTAKPSPSSKTRVTFINSRTYLEVEEGQDAVLECGLRNLASHHTVSWVRQTSHHLLYKLSKEMPNSKKKPFLFTEVHIKFPDIVSQQLMNIKYLS